MMYIYAAPTIFITFSFKDSAPHVITGSVSVLFFT